MEILQPLQVPVALFDHPHQVLFYGLIPKGNSLCPVSIACNPVVVHFIEIF